MALLMFCGLTTSLSFEVYALFVGNTLYLFMLAIVWVTLYLVMLARAINWGPEKPNEP